MPDIVVGQKVRVWSRHGYETRGLGWTIRTVCNITEEGVWVEAVMGPRMVPRTMIRECMTDPILVSVSAAVDKTRELRDTSSRLHDHATAVHIAAVAAENAVIGAALSATPDPVS